MIRITDYSIFRLFRSKANSSYHFPAASTKDLMLVLILTRRSILETIDGWIFIRDLNYVFASNFK